MMKRTGLVVAVLILALVSIACQDDAAQDEAVVQRAPTATSEGALASSPEPPQATPTPDSPIEIVTTTFMRIAPVTAREGWDEYAVYQVIRNASYELGSAYRARPREAVVTLDTGDAYVCSSEAFDADDAFYLPPAGQIVLRHRCAFPANVVGLEGSLFERRPWHPREGPTIAALEREGMPVGTNAAVERRPLGQAIELRAGVVMRFEGLVDDGNRIDAALPITNNTGQDFNLSDAQLRAYIIDGQGVYYEEQAVYRTASLVPPGLTKNAWADGIIEFSERPFDSLDLQVDLTNGIVFLVWLDESQERQWAVFPATAG